MNRIYLIWPSSMFVITYEIFCVFFFVLRKEKNKCREKKIDRNSRHGSGQLHERKQTK